jgi:tRNA-2-methylthio-N6-dimethylallyladenosine synthase
VLVEARKMVDLGYTEIQFLGQNVNSWRDPSDSPGRKSFAELLVAVGELPGIRRVRFTTSHPRDFTRDIVEAIDATPTLCDHVHLPVQSGSSAVLKAMAREYTRDWYLERMSWIKAAKRDISITSDMIVGFPGETDADFEETITLVGEVKYDAVFAFKFSPRPNTPAVTMADSIPDAVKTERLRILMDRQREIQREHYGRHLGQVQECMVESYNPARGQVVGRSSQNKTVNFTTAQIAQPPVGSYVPVRITQTLPNCLVGEAMADSAEGAAFVPVARAPQFVVLN